MISYSHSLLFGLSIFFVNGLKIQRVNLHLVTQSYCPENPVRALCNNETQQECPKERDLSGCFHGYYCFPKTIGAGGKCNLECPPICKHDQMFCAGGKMVNGCPVPDQCIDKTDRITLCPNFCPLYCDSKTHKKCNGIREKDGCKTEDYCVPLDEDCLEEVYDEYACEIFSEPKCNYQETLCKGGYDARGCPKESICVRLQNKTHPAINGLEGCATFCPPTCIKGHEVLCPETYDEDGCPEPPLCKTFHPQCPKSKYNFGTGCPVPTNEECRDHQKKQLCPKPRIRKSILKHNNASMFSNWNTTLGPMNTPMHAPMHAPLLSNTATLSTAVNISKAELPVNSMLEDEQDPLCHLGDLCVDKEDHLTNCPIYCDVQCDYYDHKICPGLMDEHGCIGPGTCVPENVDCQESQYDSNGCFIHSVVTCKDYEETCPGIRDQHGCKGRDSCIPIKGDCRCPKEEFDREGCLIHIPGPICPETHLSCPKGYSNKGCDLGRECIPIIDKETGCKNHCPAHCEDSEQSCPIVTHNYSRDPVTNCTMHEGYECVKKYDAYGCPIHCSNHCDVQELLKCPTIYNSQGCPAPEQCVHEYSSCTPSMYNSHGCLLIKQIHNCTDEYGNVDPNLQLCSGGMDSKGCPRLNTCIAKETLDGHEIFCPAVCERGQMSCSRGTFHGVHMGEICIDGDAYANYLQHTICDTHCPASCDWSHQKVCSGGYNRFTGCPLQDECVPKEEICISNNY